MHNSHSDWEDRLSEGPYRQKRFTAGMMANVEKKLLKLEAAQKRSKKPVWLAVTTTCAFLLVALLFTVQLPAWQKDNASAPPTDLPLATEDHNAATQPPEVDEELPLQLHEGNGGELTAWEHMEANAFRETDRTIIAFTKALLQKQLGAMMGLEVPSDALWEDSSRKEALAVYELSSPWVQKVYIGKVEEQDDLIQYDLDLTLTDSTGAELKETLRVDIVADTALIRDAVPMEASPDADDSDVPAN